MQEQAAIRMRLTGIRYASPGIHLYEFQPVEDGALPAFTPGAHIDLHLGNDLVRQYSLVNAPEDRARYVVGIKRDAASRGGSAFVHEGLRVGDVIGVTGPRNNFALHEDAAHSVFIAGGIGVTPIVCMVERLRALGRSWELHYSVRRREEAAFLDTLQDERLHLHVDAEHAGAFLDVPAIVAAAPADAHLYCCGPGPMLDAFEAAAGGRPAALWHIERFTAAKPSAQGGGYTVRLAASNKSIAVEPGQTILEALRGCGVHVPASCEQGICGTCETRVLQGTPDHRDSLLSEEEKKANDVMMICCSGSLSDVLVLDL
ncbi:MAG: ferredoxin [Variovorax sp.]|nr:ferredoxin [Variovorax sp.]